MKTELALCLCLALVSCKSPPPREAAPPRPKVRVVQAQEGPAARTLTVTGVLAAPPGRDVRLAPLVPGRLTRLLVSEGERVHAGQVLGEVETGPASDELQQAEATAREAASAARAAESKRARTEVLVEHGVAARQDLEQDRSAEAAAQAAGQRAQAAVGLARRKVRRSELQAPFEAIVVAVFVRQGESVDGSSGQPVVELAATDPLELRAFATQAEAARLHSRMQATLLVEGLKDLRSGEVVMVSPSVDAQSGNVLVRIRFPNPAADLRPGGLGRARIVTGQEGPAVTLPSAALLPLEDGGVGVALVEGDTVRGVPVTALVEEEGQAVVQGALKGGEYVIVEGGYSLPEGSQVEVVQ